MRRERCRGFTIIDLALVIGLAVMVGALAYSGYRTYSVRAEVAEGISAAAAAQAAVVQAFGRSGDAPATLAEAHLPTMAPSSRVLESISVENGRIDLLFGRDADTAISGGRLALTPYESVAPDVVWVCGNDIPGPGLKPLGFAGGGHQAVQIPTTIEARYLPSECRGQRPR